MNHTNDPSPFPPNTVGDEGLLEPLLEAIPGYVFLVDQDVSILKHNSAAGALLGVRRQEVLRQRGGDVLHCVHSAAAGRGCGSGAFCRDCLVRSSVTRALAGTQCVRGRFRMELLSGQERRQLYVLVSATAIPHAGTKAVLLILEDVAELMQLHHPLSFCVRCKRVRDTRHAWNEVDAYLKRQMDLLITNSYCPECLNHQTESAQIQARLASLSPREYEVFSLVIRGRLNKQIAACLGTAEKTVKIQRGRVMAKMQAGSVAELVQLAHRLDLLPKARPRLNHPA